MEPQYSVLVYSKYSKNSKRLIDTIEKSGVDFGAVLKLQSLCIDNEKARKQIEQAADIQLAIVPCILMIFPAGGVEKYDGASAFELIGSIINKYAPPPPPAPVLPPPPPRREVVEDDDSEDREEIQRHRSRPQRHAQRRSRKSEEGPPQQMAHDRRKMRDREIRGRPVQPPARMRPTGTSIDDLETDDDLEDLDAVESRHTTVPPPPRIMHSQDGYVEDSEMFRDEEDRREIDDAVKNSVKGGGEKNHLMTAAQEMMKSREQAEQSSRPQNQRPMSDRSPQSRI